MFTLFAPDESVRTPSRWIVAYTSAPPRDDKLGLQPRHFTARHIATYNEDSFTAMSNSDWFVVTHERFALPIAD